MSKQDQPQEVQQKKEAIRSLCQNSKSNLIYLQKQNKNGVDTTLVSVDSIKRGFFTKAVKAFEKVEARRGWMYPVLHNEQFVFEPLSPLDSTDYETILMYLYKKRGFKEVQLPEMKNTEVSTFISDLASPLVRAQVREMFFSDANLYWEVSLTRFPRLQVNIASIPFYAYPISALPALMAIDKNRALALFKLAFVNVPPYQCSKTYRYMIESQSVKLKIKYF